MSSPQVPSRISDITAEWFTSFLHDSGQLPPGSSVNALEVERLSVGRGFVGRVLGLRPSYQGPASLPSSFALKIGAGVAWRPSVHAGYERESRFFQHLAPRVPIRVPRCYWNSIGEGGEEFALLLEDLSEYDEGSLAEGCSAERAFLAIENLARLQAPNWRSQALRGERWIDARPAWIDVEALRQQLDSFVTRFDEFLSPDLRTTIERGVMNVETLALLGDRAPHTLVHGDYRLENMFFGPRGGPDEFVLVDFGHLWVGPTGYDLAYFLASNVPTTLRQEIQDEALQRYHGELRAGGVSEYSFEDCVADYRRGLLLALMRPIMVERTHASNLEQVAGLKGSQRARFEQGAESFIRFQHAMATRVLAAIVDSDAARVLPN